MDERRLAAALVDFAQALTRDLSVQTTLDYLTAGVLDMLPISGVGLLLAAPGHSGDPAAVDAPMSSHAGDPTGETQLGFPLIVNGHRLGVLELYADGPIALTEDDFYGLEMLTNVIGAYLFNARARSESEEFVEVLQAMALHDPLTGLPNRWLLKDRLDQALRKSRRVHRFVGLLFIDVDRLKAINDTYGHEAGDQFLTQLVARLQDVLRPGDTLARLAGDEFVVVCDDLTARVQAEEVADRMLSASKEPFAVGDVEVAVTLSIGIAFAGGEEDSATAALARADAAMYVAKRQGGGRRRTDGMLLPTT